MLAIQGNLGLSKYSGEFTDQMVGPIVSFQGSYFIFPEFAAGLEADFGSVPYHRRSRKNNFTTYTFQFGDRNNVIRSTQFQSYHLNFRIHFFPRQEANVYFFLGAGVTLFAAEDYADDIARIAPKNERTASISLPLGLGLDYFLMRNCALNVELKHTFLQTDRFDAFPVEDVQRAYMTETGNTMTQSNEGNDGYFALTFGVKYYMFEDQDIDKDLLLNSEEEALETNPYNADTDGDGLTDYEEERIYKCNPLRKDSDTDGVNDYMEIMKYRTDPKEPDTDHDGLTDGDEILSFGTNPLLPDSDGDGLNDNESISYATQPNLYDSDRDGLSDSEELLIYHTNALQQDSDGDGLNDYEEVKTYGTDPKNADTDGDGLTDFEEVVRYQTNPLKEDTDGETLSDYVELRTLGTDPLRKDTDGDSIADNIDKCPLLPETFNEYNDTDGCPDVSQPTADVTNGIRTLRQGGYSSRIDTVRLMEGSLVTLFGVNFEVDKDVIRPESIPILEENARLFTLYPELEVEIRGHTDSDADDAHNQVLSENRAESVKIFLVSHGIAAERLTTKGFGESSPIAPNTDPIGKARNRRIEFYIVRIGKREKPIDLLPIDTTRQIIR